MVTNKNIVKDDKVQAIFGAPMRLCKTAWEQANYFLCAQTYLEPELS